MSTIDDDDDGGGGKMPSSTTLDVSFETDNNDNNQDNDEFNDKVFDDEGDTEFDDDETPTDDKKTTIQNIEFEMEYLRNNNDNKVQGGIINNILDYLREKLAKPLIQADLVYMPHSKVEGDMKHNKRHLKDKNNACIYYVYEGGKIGRTTSGTKRMEKDPEYNDKKIIFIFDYENANDYAIDNLLPQALKGIQSMDGVTLMSIKDIKELTISQAKDLDKNGLSIFPRLLLQSVALPRDDFINGAADVAGFRRWLDLQLLEDSLQSDFGSRDSIRMDEASSVHEHFHSDLMTYVSGADGECSQHAHELWHKLNDEVPNLMNFSGIIKGTLGWPRGGKQPIDACKVFLLKIILGVSEQDDSDLYWDDAIDEPPSENPSQIFDATLYEQRHYKKGFEKILKLVMSIETKGGIHVLDTNDLVMQKNKATTMVPWLKERKWKEVYTCFDLVVMKYESSGSNDDQPRVIFVCRPWCWMLYSGEYSTTDQYKSQAKRAKTGHVVQAIIKLIKEGNKYDSSIQVTTHQSFWNNLLTSFAMRVYLLHNLHAFPIHATLFAKNFLSTNNNLFESDKHGMSASKNGVNRRQQNRARNNTVSYNVDTHKAQHCQNHLSLSGHNEVDDLSDRIKDVAGRIASYGSATAQRTGERITASDQIDFLNNFFRDWVKEESETGKEISSLMEAEQERHKRKLAEEQDRACRARKAQHADEEANF